MTSALSAEIREFLRRPNPAVMGTVRPDGQPVTVATWYLLDEDDRVLLTLDAARKRLAHLRADPRVSLTAMAPDNWYAAVSVQGRVVEIRDDEDLAGTDRISRHYGGQPYAVRDRPRVMATVAIEHVAPWNVK